MPVAESCPQEPDVARPAKRPFWIRAESAAATMDSNRRFYLIWFAVFYFWLTLLHALRKPFWFDEFFTLYVSRLPRFSDIWRALAGGTEANPPLNYWLTHGIFALAGDGHVTTRLTAIVGFLVMCFCVFRFVGKRCPAPYAFAAMCFPLLTMGYQYAYEGRPYGMVMGLAGLAMVSWQSAAENQNRGIALGGLALSLACAVSSHYYAVFFAGPIALGEIARSISRKRADVPIWLALGAGLTPLVALRPLIHSATSNIFARPLYSPNFFAKPGFTAMLATYSELVAPAVPVLLAGLVIVALLMARSGNPGELEAAAECRLPAHELLAAAGFAALPLAITIFTKLFTGFYVTRYTLATVVGFAILFGFVAARFLRTPGWGMLLAIVVGGGFLVVQGWWLVEPLLPATGDPGKAPITAAMDDRPLPIVVANPYVFMQLAYYGPPELRPRLVYLSEPAVVMNRGDFVPELALRWLRHCAPVRVEEYRSFVATHPRFWVYFSSIGRMEWVPSQLMKDGARLELRAENNGLELFEASAGAVK